MNHAVNIILEHLKSLIKNKRTMLDLSKYLTDRDKAMAIMETLTNEDNGYTHQELLEHVIGNYLSGAHALAAMRDCADEFPSTDFDEFTEEFEEGD